MISMLVFQITLFSLWLATGVKALQCYQCDSAIDGIDTCDDSSAHKGELVTCPSEESVGCYIVETILGEKSTLTRGCTGLSDESLYKCDTHKAGSYEYTSCNCHGDGCNEDWKTAGQSSALECYECNSTDEKGSCSDTESGELKRCGPGVDKGCFISKATYGTDVAVERGCTGISDESLYKCQTVEDNHGDEALHYCNCHGSGCNKDWSSAEGGDNQPTSKPDGPTVKCYSCDSDKGSCTDTEHGESTLDCPATQGCRIAKTLDSESPQWVRDCSLEEEMGCEESTGADGSTVLACICKTELCNENWVAAGSSTTNQGQWTNPTGAPGAASSVHLPVIIVHCLMLFFLFL